MHLKQSNVEYKYLKISGDNYKMAKILQIILLLFIFGIVAAIPIMLSNASLTGAPSLGAGGASTPQLVNGVQEIKIHASTSGYSPSAFTVKKGIPVKLIFTADKYAGCGTQLMMPDFGVNLIASEGQEVPVEFTPNQEGVFAYRCSMNMFKGKMTVVA